MAHGSFAISLASTRGRRDTPSAAKPVAPVSAERRLPRSPLRRSPPPCSIDGQEGWLDANSMLHGFKAMPKRTSLRMDAGEGAKESVAERFYSAWQRRAWPWTSVRQQIGLMGAMSSCSNDKQDAAVM
ncbi:unnamed protein product [Durusdinium trenchii]|uniref:Uncharacterized protein n=1 Tax=Durusdinium trenchii TaxID=1381693 RepID=A0ABP0PNP2_9DINO